MLPVVRLTSPPADQAARPPATELDSRFDWPTMAGGERATEGGRTELAKGKKRVARGKNGRDGRK